MLIRVYDRTEKISTEIKVDNKTTLTNLAFIIGEVFNLDMHGHAFKFCNNIRNEYASSESYLSPDSEFPEGFHGEITTGLVACESFFNTIGKKNLFIQDLGDCNEFILTRKN